MHGTPAPRLFRRRGPVFLECGDCLGLDPFALFRGELSPIRQPQLRAYAPPSSTPIELESLAAACLASLTAGVARALPPALCSVDGIEPVLQRLLELDLIEQVTGIGDPALALATGPWDDWFGPAALYHYASRWSAVVARDEVPIDAAGAERAVEASRSAFTAQAEARGAPPTHRPARGDVARAIALPQAVPTDFDRLLGARETHRLFDTTSQLSLIEVAQLLQRVFGVRGVAELGGGLKALRKAAPSGGGMHPVEAYPLIVDVEGLQPGWYHYRAGDHQLASIKPLGQADARAEIVRVAAGQSYFGTAPMIVALSLRHARHHWKYPQHARAYRVMQLEAGHVGQTFYLAATEAGLGAFFTAAINDADLDAALGLDGIEEGCTAIVGCGRPAPEGAALRLSNYVSR